MKHTNDVFGRLGEILRPTDPLTRLTVLPGERDIPFDEKVERLRIAHLGETVAPSHQLTTTFTIVRVCDWCEKRNPYEAKHCMDCGRKFVVRAER